MNRLPSGTPTGDAPTNDWTLGSAHDWLLRGVMDGQCLPCPCCKKDTRIYAKRQVHSTIVRALCAMYQAEGNAWAHVPQVASGSCEAAKARYWGLVEESFERREDGGHAGWWRLTPKGVDFLHGRITIPKYAKVFRGRCLELWGPQVSAAECANSKFRLDELLTPP